MTQTHCTANCNRPIEIEGVVKQILNGCGVATIQAGACAPLSVNRGVAGSRFDNLRVGASLRCRVCPCHYRVVQLI